MDNAVETIEYLGHQIEIFPDMNPESPREWDNLCVFHIAHKRYAFGDVNHNSLESIKEAEKEAKRNGDIILPLYMYDHSGITISLSPFSCPWDSGQVGFVAIPRKKAIEEFGKKVFTKKIKEKALRIAHCEVESLDYYIRGDMYGYMIDDGEDSCWGYFGIKDCTEQAKEVVDYMVKQEKKEYCEKVKQWIKNKVPLIYRKELAP